MLIREDLGVLVLGAREAIFALDLNDISVEKTAVYCELQKRSRVNACRKENKLRWNVETTFEPCTM